MDWRERIVLNPKVLAKPLIKGTWLSVEFILGQLIAGLSAEQVLAEHEDLTLEDVRACLACAKDVLAVAHV